ncbi:MAG TPA: hypothetical protein VFW44_18300 [Bryobacteraceae bacterium]|nr:hypothetical protein [Bryobacteraceae bacterium]
MLVVGAFYFWIIGIGAVPDRFAWNSGLDQYYGLPSPGIAKGSWDINGYYDLLGRAFAGGHLYLPIAPQPELLALANPQDNRFNGPYKLLDTVLYRRRYYLYHGATPALLLFAPWYLITRHDLPENFAAFLFAIAGYFFLSRLFVDFLAFAGARISTPFFVLCLIALGTGASVPFMLHRVKVYEVAIACGFCCTSAGFYFLFRWLSAQGARVWWAGLSGLCFGLAIGARPHLGLAAAAGFFLIALLARRDLLVFAVPVIACIAAIAAYNYARFGNPLEFGLRYQLADTSYQHVHLSAANERLGLYFLLVCPPDLVPEFPFLRLTRRHPVPPDYFYEPTGGVVDVSPIACFAILLPFFRKRFKREILAFLLAVSAFAVCCILFVAATGLTSQRFEVDFAPFLLLVGCVVAVALVRDLRGRVKALAASAVGLVFLWTIGANVALALQGPYDQFIQSSPDAFVKLSKWFSPVARFRLLENPAFQASASFDFTKPCTPGTWPLVSTGEFGSRYLLSAACDFHGNLQLLSETSVQSSERRIIDVPYAEGYNLVRLSFTPADRIMTVSWNDKVVLRQPLRFLITAPSQIHFGWDPTWGNQTVYPLKFAVYESKISTH